MTACHTSLVTTIPTIHQSVTLLRELARCRHGCVRGQDRRDRTSTRYQTACEGRHNPRDTCQHCTPFKLLIAIINLHVGVFRPGATVRIAIHHGLGLCPLYMIIGSGASALGTSPLFRGFRLGGSWEIIRTTKHSHFRLASRSPIPRTTDPNPRYKTETKFFTPNFQTS
jgi:hypothetical protein